MAAPGLGTRAGTMHVRVLPDTTGFKRDLKRRLVPMLKQLENELPALSVQLDKVRLSRAKIKAQIKAELADIDDLTVSVGAKVDRASLTEAREAVEKMAESLDPKANLKVLTKLDDLFLQRARRDIENSLRDIEVNISPDNRGAARYVEALNSEFERLHGKLRDQIMSPEDEAIIKHRINSVKEKLDDLAKDRTVRVDVNPFTAWAAARLAWLTRPRVVEIIPQVSKTALAKTLTALSALSGARLSYDYFKRFSDWISEVDKKLPRLTFSTLGLTTAFSALMASISGIVGIGDGLAATLPSFLLLPGLMAGAVMSGVTLFVALKDAKDQLSELGDGYTNLGRIIKSTFWGQARQPIIDFSNSVMPQLERSFEKTALAMGRFTGALAGSFQREFAGGRLEAMFDGLAGAWDELAKGTDGFAGAITNLGLVASRYMPRLATWFVRQADTFDAWLSKVSTNGRLDAMIEESIDAYYALWDVAAATTGILQGLWKAAESAGSGGLRGFADTLMAWDRAINGAKWQATLEAMFRGAGKAMSGFADGLERVGEMLYDLREPIEYLMGEAGQTLGTFIGDIADALSTEKVGQGIRDFIDGVSGGLEGLSGALDPVSDTFGELLSFIGELADALGDVLGTVGSELAPEVEKILERVQPKIDDLATAFSDAVKDVDWDELGDQAADALESIVDLAADLAPLLADVANFAIDSGVLVGVKNLADDLGTVADALRDINDLLGGDELSDDAFSDGWGVVDAISNLQGAAGPAGVAIKFLFDQLEKLPGLTEALDEGWAEIPTWFEDFSGGLEDLGGSFETFKENVGALFSDAYTWLLTSGADILNGLRDGMFNGFVSVTLWLAQIPENVKSFFAGAREWIVSHGAALLDGFRSGAMTGFGTVVMWFARIPSQVTSFFSNAGSWLVSSGYSALMGFAEGVQQAVAVAVAKVAAAVATIRGLFPNSPAKFGPFSGRGWVSYSGQSVGETFGKSMVESLNAARGNVSRTLAGIQSEFTALDGTMSGSSIGVNVAGMATAGLDYSSSLRAASATAAPSSGMSIVANFNQPEQREQLRELVYKLERFNR